VQLASLVKDRLNVAGENHDESNIRRQRERDVALVKTGSGNYWQENQFTKTAESKEPADPYELRYEQILQFGLTFPFSTLAAVKKEEYLEHLMYDDAIIEAIEKALATFYADDLEAYGQEIEMYGDRTMRAVWIAGLRRVILHHCSRVKGFVKDFREKSTSEEDIFVSIDYVKVEQLMKESAPLDKSLNEIIEGLNELNKALLKAKEDFDLGSRDVSLERSEVMHKIAQTRADSLGLWKVGEEHADDMKHKEERQYNLLSRSEFNDEL